MSKRIRKPIWICDRCGVEVESESRPEKWSRLVINAGIKVYDLCEPCAEEILTPIVEDSPTRESADGR